jgi:hypothetical protein
LTFHVQDDPGLWQSGSNNGNELRNVHDMDDVAVLARGLRSPRR